MGSQSEGRKLAEQMRREGIRGGNISFDLPTGREREKKQREIK